MAEERKSAAAELETTKASYLKAVEEAAAEKEAIEKLQAEHKHTKRKCESLQKEFDKVSVCVCACTVCV